MPPRNVLILAAGRRGMLTRYFCDEVRRLSPESIVIAGDLKPQLSAACQLADRSVATPPIKSPDYAQQLLDLCVKNRVGVVVPTIDTDLLVLAENRSRFVEAGVEILTPDATLVRRCRDKRLTTALFAEHGIGVPPSVDPTDKGSYPLIAKPSDGSSSNGLYLADSPADLPREVFSDPKYLFQRYLPPAEHEEYSIDMYFDGAGAMRCAVPRLRLETRAGEVSKSRTTKHGPVRSVVERLRNLPGARGCLTVQVFLRLSDGEVFGVEVNPRFGGGFPLSYAAGANYPAWIVREHLLGEPIDDHEDWTDGLTMLRYDAHVLVPSAA